MPREHVQGTQDVLREFGERKNPFEKTERETQGLPRQGGRAPSGWDMGARGALHGGEEPARCRGAVAAGQARMAGAQLGVERRVCGEGRPARPQQGWAGREAGRGLYATPSRAVGHPEGRWHHVGLGPRPPGQDGEEVGKGEVRGGR